MKFKHKGVFVPADSEEIKERVFHTILRDKRVSRNKIPKLVKRNAVSDGCIDTYAIRNHWTLAMGQTKIVDKSWESVDDAKDKLLDIADVTDVKYKESKTKSYYVGYVKSGNPQNKKKEVKKKLSDDIPIFCGRAGFEVQMRFMWVGDGDFFFDDIENVWGENFDT